MIIRLYSSQHYPGVREWYPKDIMDSSDASGEYDKNWAAVPASEVANYLENVVKSSDDPYFKDFRSSVSWGIWEGGEKEIGLVSIRSIKKFGLYREFLRNIQMFKLNDLYGSPKLYDFDLGIENISSSTIQYSRDALIINDKLFSREITHPLVIVEIGAGYGGLCRILSEIVDIESYFIVDLPEVLSLAKKYLSNYPKLDGKVHFVDGTKAQLFDEAKNFDLAIACASMAELSEKNQDKYNEQIILRSDNVYLAYNTRFTYLGKKVFAKLIDSWIKEFSISTFRGMQGINLVMRKSKSKFSLLTRLLLIFKIKGGEIREYFTNVIKRFQK